MNQFVRYCCLFALIAVPTALEASNRLFLSGEGTHKNQLAYYAGKEIQEQIRKSTYRIKQTTICSGVAISPKYVLAAGHCLLPQSNRLVQAFSLSPSRQESPTLLTPHTGLLGTSSDFLLLRKKAGVFKTYIEPDFSYDPRTEFFDPKNELFVVSGYSLDTEYARKNRTKLAAVVFGEIRYTDFTYAITNWFISLAKKNPNPFLDFSTLAKGQRNCGHFGSYLYYSASAPNGFSGSPLLRIRKGKDGELKVNVVGVHNRYMRGPFVPGVRNSLGTPLFVVGQILQEKDSEVAAELKVPVSNEPFDDNLLDISVQSCDEVRSGYRIIDGEVEMEQVTGK